MRAGASFRGQPLLVLLVLLGGWIALRMEVWQPPFAFEAAASPAQMTSRRTPPAAPHAVEAMPRPSSPQWHFGTAQPRPPCSAEPLPPPSAWRDDAPHSSSAPADQTETAARRLSLRVPARRQIVLGAAFSRVPIPDDLAFLFAAAHKSDGAGSTVQPPVRTFAARQGSHWSADGWLLLRRDTTTPVTSGRGSYGRSQMGAVLRYRLSGEDLFRSTAYLRATKALAGAQETELAAGFAARPFPRVPVTTAAEIRLTEVGGKVHERTAAYAVTELPAFELPAGFTAEAYAQGGYVWGDFSTFFVDGQLRAERPLVRLGEAALSAGGGAWGGAQKGAARLDIGPSATLALKLGDTKQKPVNARLSMDWRFRVAGEAESASGPALTISAGF